MIELSAVSPASTLVHTARPEAHSMLFTECPLCDAPTPLDAATGALDCPACAVRLELAPDETVELAAAA